MALEDIPNWLLPPGANPLDYVCTLDESQADEYVRNMQETVRESIAAKRAKDARHAASNSAPAATAGPSQMKTETEEEKSERYATNARIDAKIREETGQREANRVYLFDKMLPCLESSEARERRLF